MAGKRLLVVEGKDDCHVCWTLFEHHDVPDTFKVKAEDGYESLREALPVYLKSSYEALGFVVDADFDLAARWQALADVARDAGYQDVPDAPDAAGTILRHPTRARLGFWLMPDNTLPGMLEHFLAMLIPDGDGLWPLSQQAIAGLPSAERRFIDAHQPKAEIHTWLAWQQQPGQPFGTAITCRALDAGRPQAQIFVDWIRRLFG